MSSGATTNTSASSVNASAASNESPAVEYFGRFDFSQSAGARFAWPGSAIKARFNGTSVAVKIRNAGGNINFTAVIDNGTPTIFKSTAGSTSTFALATGLANGEHSVLVVRNNEAWNGPTQFLGFDFGKGSLMAPAAATSTHRMEVYGDSISAAYGNMRTANCSSYSVDDQNAYLGYAAKAARTLGMPPPTLIAWSGKGVYHNGSGAPANVDTIPATYDRVVGSEALLWDFSAAKAPDIVIVELGTNDVTALPSGEFPSTSVLSDAYVSFARKLRSKYPQATLLFAVGPMSTGYQAAVTNAVATLKSGGDAAVYAMTFSQNRQPFGCESHPSEAQHTVMAGELVTFLRQLGY